LHPASSRGVPLLRAGGPPRVVWKEDTPPWPDAAAAASPASSRGELSWVPASASCPSPSSSPLHPARRDAILCMASRRAIASDVKADTFHPSIMAPLSNRRVTVCPCVHDSAAICARRQLVSSVSLGISRVVSYNPPVSMSTYTIRPDNGAVAWARSSSGLGARPALWSMLRARSAASRAW
jgi:hypothetical protein